MGLSIRDILILDFFNGKPLHTKIPAFQQDIYGKTADIRIRELCEEGWIRHSRPQETVNLLPDKALSDFLSRHNLPSGGSHTELVRSVIRDIPESEYAHAVPKVYVTTADGQQEIAHHMAYILNARGSYGFSDGEIGEAQRTLTVRQAPASALDIIACAFQQKSALFILAGEWTKLRNLYFTWANFCLRSGSHENALAHLFLVFLLDMSGMENRNTLCPYEKLFPTQKGIIILIKELCGELSLAGPSVKSLFLSTIARQAPRLPFSYFSPQTMATLLMERLQGKEFNHTHYLSLRNNPDPSASAYHWSPGPEPAEKGTASRPSAPLSGRKTPPVPPVLRLPSFTAPPPFVPPGSTPSPAATGSSAPTEDNHAPQRPQPNRQTGWLGRLHTILSKPKKK